MHFPDVTYNALSRRTYSWGWHCAPGRHIGRTIVYARPAIMTPDSAQDIDMHCKPNHDHNMPYDEYEPISEGEDLPDCESTEQYSEYDIDDMFYESYEELQMAGVNDGAQSRSGGVLGYAPMMKGPTHYLFTPHHMIYYWY